MLRPLLTAARPRCQLGTPQAAADGRSLVVPRPLRARISRATGVPRRNSCSAHWHSLYEANRAASASTGSRLNVCCACKPPRACLRRRDKRPARRLLLCFALVTLAAAATALGRLAGHWTVKIKARSHSVCQHLVLPPPPPCFNYWAGHPRLACSQPSALPAKVSIAPHGPQHRSLR